MNKLHLNFYIWIYKASKVNCEFVISASLFKDLQRFSLFDIKSQILHKPYDYDSWTGIFEWDSFQKQYFIAWLKSSIWLLKNTFVSQAFYDISFQVHFTFDPSIITLNRECFLLFHFLFISVFILPWIFLLLFILLFQSPKKRKEKSLTFLYLFSQHKIFIWWYWSSLHVWIFIVRML